MPEDRGEGCSEDVQISSRFEYFPRKNYSFLDEMVNTLFKVVPAGQICSQLNS